MQSQYTSFRFAELRVMWSLPVDLMDDGIMVHCTCSQKYFNHGSNYIIVLQKNKQEKHKQDTGGTPNYPSPIYDMFPSI